MPTILVLFALLLPASVFSEESRCGEIYSLSREDECAVVFDEPGCRGWNLTIKGHEAGQGYMKLPEDKQSSIQSVLVRRGCVFYGYERDWSGGFVVTVSAYKKTEDVADNLSNNRELSNKVNAIACYCSHKRRSGVYYINKRRTWKRAGKNEISTKEAAPPPPPPPPPPVVPEAEIPVAQTVAPISASSVPDYAPEAPPPMLLSEGEDDWLSAPIQEELETLMPPEEEGPVPITAPSAPPLSPPPPTVTMASAGSEDDWLASFTGDADPWFDSDA